MASLRVHDPDTGDVSVLSVPDGVWKKYQDGDEEAKANLNTIAEEHFKGRRQAMEPKPPQIIGPGEIPESATRMIRPDLGQASAMHRPSVVSDPVGAADPVTSGLNHLIRAAQAYSNPEAPNHPMMRAFNEAVRGAEGVASPVAIPLGLRSVPSLVTGSIGALLGGEAGREISGHYKADPETQEMSRNIGNIAGGFFGASPQLTELTSRGLSALGRGIKSYMDPGFFKSFEWGGKNQGPTTSYRTVGPDELPEGSKTRKGPTVSAGPLAGTEGYNPNAAGGKASAGMGFQLSPEEIGPGTGLGRGGTIDVDARGAAAPQEIDPSILQRLLQAGKDLITRREVTPQGPKVTFSEGQQSLSPGQYRLTTEDLRKMGSNIERPAQIEAPRPQLEAPTKPTGKTSTINEPPVEPKEDQYPRGTGDKMIATEGHVQKHANSQGSTYEDALNAFPSDQFEIRDKRGMQNLLLGAGKKKGISPDNLRTDIRNAFGKGLSDLTDEEMHDYWKTLLKKPDNPLKKKSDYSVKSGAPDKPQE